MAPPKGGFDYITYNRRLEAIRLPDNVLTLRERVKCKICKKIRMQNYFSKRQLEELRKAMLKFRTTGIDGPGYAGCLTCMNGQTVELTCCVCDKTMPLEFFSKNQRHDPDNARCLNCVQGHLELEPVSEDIRDTIEDGSTYGTTTISQSQGGDYLDSMNSLSLADNGQHWQEGSVGQGSHAQDSTVGGYDSDDDDEFSVAGGTGNGGVWIEQGRRHPLTEASNEGGGTNLKFTAFDPQGNPHSREADTASVAQSVAPTVHSGWEEWGVVDRRKENATPTPSKQKGNRNFAKAPGTRFPKNEAPTMRRAQPVAPTIESDDDDDDDDDPQNYI
ncbi:hypothetical protein AJ79_05924 [Helicocarpus griseus UAMH5409]|uniref:Stc1 domain-containing protein n=1 Tax=Helicocarpus griseus UAMH5409 TaxID=1447875 RepID=A0A2B7XIZ2_9EURO|nr:hypothetical protein AJ79_05924 [Helicocarpus griseus UAMH5409]